METKYCISVDWLQVYCTNNHWATVVGGEEIGIEKRLKNLNNSIEYTIKRADIETSLWMEVYRVYVGGITVATICRKPRSGALDKDGLTIKLENRTLYCEQYVQMMKDIIDATGSIYRGVTRIDICYDCNVLKENRNVQKFLYDYITAPAYQTGHIIRSGSSRVAMHGKRGTGGAMVINSMRWGSPTSAVGAYCYNKSLELLEVKDKPWIRDVWSKNGLIHEVDDLTWNKYSERQKKSKIEDGYSLDYIHTPVWRFEISIKAGGNDILNVNTGELYRISLDYLSVQEKVEDLFYIYAGKVMDFRVSNGQTRIRYYNKMELFERKEPGKVCERPYKLSRYADTGRTEKICYNKLEEIEQRYGDLADGQLHSIQAAKDLLLTISGLKSEVVRMRREAAYLNNMMADRTIRQENGVYLEAVNEAWRAKRNIDPDSFYCAVKEMGEYVSKAVDYQEGIDPLIV